MLGAAEGLAQAVEGSVLAVVAVDVLQQREELREGGVVDAAAMLGEAGPGALTQLIERPAGLGDADHGNVEMAPLDHRLQGGKDHLVSEIAGRAEEDERVGMWRGRHECCS